MAQRERGIPEPDRTDGDRAQLSRAFEQALAGQDATFQLIVAIRDYTTSCRESNLPPEKMLVGFKQALGFDRFGNRGGELVERTITECIRQFYAEQWSPRPQES